MSSARLRHLFLRFPPGLRPSLQPKSAPPNPAWLERASSRGFSSLCTSRDPLVNYPPASHYNFTAKRFKKAGKKAQTTSKDDDDADDDEDDEDELAAENPLLVDDVLSGDSDGSENVTLDVGSLRLDAFAKVAFGSSRAKIEELFYKGDLFVNGQRASKKSQDLFQNDEIDLVKNVNQDDHTLVDIRRVHIVSLPDKTTEAGRMKVKITRWQNLTIKPHTSRED